VGGCVVVCLRVHIHKVAKSVSGHNTGVYCEMTLVHNKMSNSNMTSFKRLESKPVVNQFPFVMCNYLKVVFFKLAQCFSNLRLDL
jgi:hypothetical protein